MMEVDDDFTDRSAAFTNWLKTSGAILSDKIELADLRKQNAGRGVVATQDIDEEEELFSIPRNILLNVKNSDFSTEHPHLLEHMGGDQWLELILTMLYEDAQPNSKWRPYFDVLPGEGQFDTLMYWDENELKELEASGVVHKIGRESATKTFLEKIGPALRDDPPLFGFGIEVNYEELVKAAHRMGSLIMAYAFDIESDREREIDEEGYVSDEEDEDMPKAMVPMADMLNADAERNNARLFYEPNALVMKAIKPIAKGEEIFNWYGPLPRSDLLRRYGYVTDNHAQWDVVEIPSQLILDTAAEMPWMKDTNFEERVQERAAHLETFEQELEEGYDISRPIADSEEPLSILTPELKLLIALLSFPDPTLPPAIKPSKLEKLISRNEFPSRWYSLLLAVLEARLAQYGSPLEEDQKHMVIYKQRLQSGMWLTNQRETRRKYMALCVRVGEKEVLVHAIETVAELGEKSRATENAAKRKPSELSDESSRSKRAKRRG